MIQLVVFDMAGTTIRDGNAVKNSFQAALAAAGLNVPDDAVLAVMGLPKPEAIRRLLGQRPGLEGAVAPIHADFVARMKHYYAADPAVHEVPGAGAAFNVLRAAGVKVALNTGFSRDIVDVIIDRLGWANKIDATLASDEVARGRPHPDMIYALMVRFGVTDPANVCKVGDTRADLEEAHNAGCGLAIGVMSGSSTREQLQGCPHTHILASVAEVPAIVLATK